MRADNKIIVLILLYASNVHYSKSQVLLTIISDLTPDGW